MQAVSVSVNFSGYKLNLFNPLAPGYYVCYGAQFGLPFFRRGIDGGIFYADYNFGGLILMTN